MKKATSNNTGKKDNGIELTSKKWLFNVTDFNGIKLSCFNAMASYEDDFRRIGKNGGKLEILLKSNGKKEFSFEEIQIAIGLFNCNYEADLIGYATTFDIKKYDNNGKLNGNEIAIKFIVCRENDKPSDVKIENCVYDDLPKKLKRDSKNRGKKDGKPSDASDADNGKKTDAVVEDIVLRQLKKFTPKVIAVGVTNEQLKKIEDAFKTVFTDYLNEV